MIFDIFDRSKPNDTLYTIAVYSNPLNSVNRKTTFTQFINEMKNTSHVKLVVVEVSYNNAPFEFNNHHEYQTVQLHATDLLWVKENAVNIAVKHLPKDWKYMAYVDGDFHFTRHDWAKATIEMLKTTPVIQLYSGYAFMSATHVPIWCRPSFAYCYHTYFNSDRTKLENATKPLTESGSDIFTGPPVGSLGGAIGMTRATFEGIHGLPDWAILGSGDLYTAYSCVGVSIKNRDEVKYCDPAYINKMNVWMDNAYKVVKGNIGYIDQLIMHQWHGCIINRNYETRWQILEKFHFNPDTDIKYDYQGLIQFTGNKPGFKEAVHEYFVSRDEDSNTSKIRGMY